jgi:hypothetical protein
MAENRFTMPTRKYDKGERRFKHEGRESEPTIYFERSRPRRWIGKCPAGMSAELCWKLLNEAISAPVEGQEIDYPKYLYVVHNGAIYEARTSDCGISYHGYPYRGRLSKAIIVELRRMARQKDCLEAFEAWIAQHIETQK